jgi:hypothetical protein
MEDNLKKANSKGNLTKTTTTVKLAQLIYNSIVTNNHNHVFTEQFDCAIPH